MRIKDYPQTDTLESSDSFVIDGDKGTGRIETDDLKNELGITDLEENTTVKESDISFRVDTSNSSAVIRGTITQSSTVTYGNVCFAYIRFTPSTTYSVGSRLLLKPENIPDGKKIRGGVIGGGYTNGVIDSTGLWIYPSSNWDTSAKAFTAFILLVDV